MTPADYAWPDDDLRGRLEIVEATNHVLTEALHDVTAVLTPAQVAILGLPGHLSRPLGVGPVSRSTEGTNDSPGREA